MRTLLSLLVLVASTGVAFAAQPVTVYLDRDGEVQRAHDGEDAVTIPRFGGVQKQYAPFAVTFVTERPASGAYITAVVGGYASQLGLDDHTTNGVGPYDGSVIPNAVVHIFSKVGTGEHDVENLCAVTAHEVGHALGLDHEYYCGDVMSYYLDQCGARRFIDVDAPCGEEGPRACGNGDEQQNSYQRIGRNVGWADAGSEARRPAVDHDPQPPAQVDPDDGDDGATRRGGNDDASDPWAGTRFGHKNRQPSNPQPDSDDAGAPQSPRDPWGEPAPQPPATTQAPQDPYGADDSDDDEPQQAQVQYDQIRPTRATTRTVHGKTYVIRVRWTQVHGHRRHSHR
jgi:hypothetical protein